MQGINIMQVTDELIRSVVQEVLAHMRNGRAAPANGKTQRWGVFDDVDAAVAAAVDAQKEFEGRPMEDRRKAVDCIAASASIRRKRSAARNSKKPRSAGWCTKSTS
jgi:acyl-CoA reductase-like NAD-dependent aldehyde dehydrogenase